MAGADLAYDGELSLHWRVNGRDRGMRKSYKLSQKYKHQAEPTISRDDDVLNPFILQAVCHYINPLKLIQLACVCKLWKEITETDEIWFSWYLHSTFEHGEELTRTLTPRPDQAGVLSWKHVYEQRLAANILSVLRLPNQPGPPLLNGQTLFVSRDDFTTVLPFRFNSPSPCVTWFHLSLTGASKFLALRVPERGPLRLLDPEAAGLQVAPLRLALALDPGAQALHAFLWVRGELLHQCLAWPGGPFLLHCGAHRISLVGATESLELTLAERIKQKLRRSPR